MLPIVILAGGLGTRIKEVTGDLPKSMVLVSGKPFLYWQLILLRDSGYRDFVLCVSHGAERITEYLGDGCEFGINVRYSYDGSKQIGTGGAILNAIPLLGENFAVLYGDSYLPINFKEIETAFLEKECKALMTVFKNSDKFGESNIEFSNGRILRYSKKTANESMEHIDYGLSYFNASVFSNLSIDTPIDLSYIIEELVTNDEISGFEVFQRFYEVGSISGLKDFSELMERSS
jgi:MurNAc alpha-1-phosphate uridylyltransferase